MVMQVLTGAAGGKPERFPESQQAQATFSMHKGKRVKRRLPQAVCTSETETDADTEIMVGQEKHQHGQIQICLTSRQKLGLQTRL